LFASDLKLPQVALAGARLCASSPGRSECTPLYGLK
jgi:hypothetical protein